MDVEYAILIKNKTRLEALIERFNTKSQARFYIERQGGDFNDYEKEDAIFYDSLHKLQAGLSKVIKYKIVERSFLSSYIFSEKNVIVTIGQDGLVANTAKYSRGVPIVAVNPDPKRYDGVLLPFDVTNFQRGVEDVMAGTCQLRKVNFAEARLNDGQRLLAFNDLFIGAASHISARYRISYGNETEEHSSSGIIISTQAGSTGWLSSVFNMAYGVAGLFEKNLTLKHPKLKEEQLLFVVREPFRSLRTQTGLSVGLIDRRHPLRIESFMPAGGVIFSDGIESDYLNFNSGSVVSVGIAEEVANLVEMKK